MGRWVGSGEVEAVAGATGHEVAVQVAHGLDGVRTAAGEVVPLAAQLLDELAARWRR
jgi:hypothetical protein